MNTDRRNAFVLSVMNQSRKFVLVGRGDA